MHRRVRFLCVATVTLRSVYTPHPMNPRPRHASHDATLRPSALMTRERSRQCIGPERRVAEESVLAVEDGEVTTHALAWGSRGEQWGPIRGSMKAVVNTFVRSAIASSVLPSANLPKDSPSPFSSRVSATCRPYQSRAVERWTTSRNHVRHGAAIAKCAAFAGETSHCHFIPSEAEHHRRL
jgi:hypothetical protein